MKTGTSTRLSDSWHECQSQQSGCGTRPLLSAPRPDQAHINLNLVTSKKLRDKLHDAGERNTSFLCFELFRALVAHTRLRAGQRFHSSNTASSCTGTKTSAPREVPPLARVHNATSAKPDIPLTYPQLSSKLTKIHVAAWARSSLQASCGRQQLWQEEGKKTKKFLRGSPQAPVDPSRSGFQRINTSCSRRIANTFNKSACACVQL